MTSAAVQSNRLMFKKLVVAALLMLGFGFALVPFYRKICEVTGVNDTKVEAFQAESAIDPNRWVTVEFVTSVNQDMPWSFTPAQSTARLHPGELLQVDYRVKNLTDRVVEGQAVPSYGPALAGQYLKKIQCFCFNKQILQPYEERTMPVLFFVDPKLPDDVGTISLSYTFFELDRQAGGKG